MKQVREWLVDAYGTTLAAYLHDENEETLERGYLVGREGMQRGLGPMELTSVHHELLTKYFADRPERLTAVTLSRAARLLVESLAAFEMVQRGYVEANVALRSLNTELESKTDELARTNAVLMRTQQQKDQLSALLVHDLKNPLSGIMLNARFLLRDLKGGTDQRKALENINTASRSMLMMVMNLLDISRSEDGALSPNRSRIEIATLLEDVAAAHRIHATDAQISLIVKAAADLEISADADLLRRVMANLVDNAVRHTPTGGNISIEAARDDASHTFEICVRDDGHGIPDEQRDRVFEKYAQVDPEHGTGVRFNRGLGLVFCRLAVEAHGGTISAAANQPRGTVFRITLPCA